MDRQEFTITLDGDTINEEISGQDPRVKGLITNMPDGVDIIASPYIADNATSFKLIILESSIPTEGASGPFEITIPGSMLNGGQDIVVTPNPEAKWDIAEADPGEASATVDDVTVSGTVGTSIRFTDIKIKLINDALSKQISFPSQPVLGMLKNAPAGIELGGSGFIERGETELNLVMTGTPTEAASGPIELVIPGEILAGGKDITVTANPNAKWDITGAGTDTGNVSLVGSATGNAPTPTLPDPDAARAAVLTEQDHEDIANGSTINIALETKEHNPPVGDIQAVSGALNGHQVGMYLDISLFKQKDSDPRQSITQIGAPILIGMDVPASLQRAGRTFSVIRVHDGVATVLPNHSTEPNKLLIETDRFSTYAIVYRDAAATQGVSPKTGDGTFLGLWIALLAAAALVIGVTLVQRRKKAREYD